MANEWLLGLRPRVDSPIAVASCCTRATVAAAEAELGPGAVAWAIEVAAHAVDAALGRVSGLEKLRDPRDLLRAGCEACVLTVLRGLKQELPAERLQVPAEGLTGVRDMVRAEVPLDRILRLVWTCHVYTYEALLAAVEEAGEPDCSAGAVRRLTDLAFAYLDAVTENGAKEYAAEQERWLGTVMAARRGVIDEILAGHLVNTAEAEAVLGSGLTHYHQAIVLWAVPQEPARSSASAQRLRRVAQAMAHALCADNVLTVPGVESAVWAWLSWKQPPPVGVAAAMREVLPAELRVAVGPVGRGLEGFRRTHLCARQAQRISRLGAEQPVCEYTEVAVVSLLTAGPEHVHWFVEDQLGALAGVSAKLAELRETLRLYLTFGRSRIAVAEQMHIAANTVAYRVKRAEGILGRALVDDELQLRLALEIVNLLPDEFSIKAK